MTLKEERRQSMRFHMMDGDKRLVPLSSQSFGCLHAHAQASRYPRSESNSNGINFFSVYGRDAGSFKTLVDRFRQSVIVPFLSAERVNVR